ncbi:universal stress protein [uncultured Desulfuromonas sp.]|uniref:universal stress protein n=1 Tax=uncultured Desulfuromonas sp. TaxID=181013 RepID=UPI002AAAE25C|nr:universal stress protein [uncultured Desulfuromonas sp.]
MLPHYQKILFATDLSAGAAEVLRHAISLARAYQSEVAILHVLPDVNPSVINEVALVMGTEQLADYELAHTDDVMDTIRQQVQRLAAQELADHPDDLARIKSIEVHHGPPATTILEEAERCGADLLVLGAHGRKKLKYALLGSVAKRVILHAAIPVLLVHLDTP